MPQLCAAHPDFAASMPHSENELARRGTNQGRLSIALMCLAWVFILLRVWTRTCLISKFGWDDATMIFAGMLFTVYCASLIAMQNNGGGTHVTSIEQLKYLTNFLVVSQTTYLASMMMLKVSLGIFFARIVVTQWHLTLIYITVGINTLSSVAAFFYVIFRCGPRIDDYIIRQLSGHCASDSFNSFMAYQQASITTLTDVIFLALPVLMLWGANMDKRSKYSVGFILSLAALGCICSMLRFRYVDGLAVTEDFFWNAVSIAIWSTVEIGAGIVAGCAATLRPILRGALKQARESETISGAMQHVSRSLQSRGKQDSGTGSGPRLNTADTTTNTSSRAFSRDTIDKPTFAEFLALSGQEVVPVKANGEIGRSSTDPILGNGREVTLSEWGTTEPDASQQDEQTHKEKKNFKRQTVHGKWTLQRGVATDGRCFQGHMEAPVSPPEVRDEQNRRQQEHV